MQVTGPLVETIRNKNPGPGSYQLPSTLAKTTFTIGARNVKEDKEKKQVPGPGACNIFIKSRSCDVLHQPEWIIFPCKIQEQLC